jgi:hypothetical protein
MKVRARASRLKFKIVNKVYVSSIYKCNNIKLLPTARTLRYIYKIIKLTPIVEVTKLNKYVFIIRIRINKCYGFYKKVLWLK